MVRLFDLKSNSDAPMHGLIEIEGTIGSHDNDTIMSLDFRQKLIYCLSAVVALFKD